MMTAGSNKGKRHRRNGGQRWKGKAVKKLVGRTVGTPRRRIDHVTTTVPVGTARRPGPLPHWEDTPPPRPRTTPVQQTTTTTTVAIGKDTGSLHAIHGAMIGCALALILILTPMLALFGRKALARRRMRQFQSKRGNVAGCDPTGNKIYAPQDARGHHQVVARVESRDVGTAPEMVVDSVRPVNNNNQQQQQATNGFTLIENLAYGDFIGCTDATHPAISLSPPFDGKNEASRSAVDVVYVNLGSNISRNKRRREHAYEMIDSTSAGLQIRENLHPLPDRNACKRNSRDKVTSFPFHPGCSESSDSARLDAGDYRMLFGTGYERRLSARAIAAKKHHLPLWSGNVAGSIRYKQPIAGSIASSFTRGKEEQTTTTMEQLMRDRGGTRVRRKRKLKRRTHDLRRKRAHIRRIAAIKRHQVVVGGGKRDVTIVEVEEEANNINGGDRTKEQQQRRISTGSAVSNYGAAAYGCLRSELVDAALSSSSRHSTMDRGYGTGVSLGKFRLPSISEHERNSVNAAAAAAATKSANRRFTVHGALPSTAIGHRRSKNITTTTASAGDDVIKKSGGGGRNNKVEELKTFTRSKSSSGRARKPVLKSKSVPHLNRIEPAAAPPGNYLKESTSVLDVLGCYMKSKNYNTDSSRSVLRIRDSKLYPAAPVPHKQATEDSTCSGGSVVSCPLLGVQPTKKPSKPSPLSRERPRSAILGGTATKARAAAASKRSKKQKSRSLHDVALYDIMPLDPSTENLSVFMEMSI